MKNYKTKLSEPDLKGNELTYISKAIASNEIGPRGYFLDTFEAELAEFVGTKYAVGLTSGTAAIHLALKVIGVKKGDAVLCSTFTFAATAFPILYLGANPVFIDSEIETWNICPNLLEQAIVNEMATGNKPKAILVVHTYGMPADMDRIQKISKKYNIPIIEDAAAALGSTYKGEKCGAIGDIGIFSFNANKIISTGGGGALVSKNKEYTEKAKYYATQSKEKTAYYLHKNIGFNYRMSNITAAIGLAQLEQIEKVLIAKRNIYKQYQDRLSSAKSLTFQKETSDIRTNRWLTCLLLRSKNERIELIKNSNDTGIEIGRLWNPLHCQPVFEHCKRYLNGTAEELFKKGVTLPSSISLNMKEQKRICTALLSLKTYD